MNDYTYTYDKLKSVLNTEKGIRFVDGIKRLYEKEYENKPITVLSYAKYKLVHINGNRAAYEEGYFDRRRRLCFLQVLALADDRYLDDLEDLLSAICEEYSWVLPCHNMLSYKRFDYTEIDLFSSETAFYLSETAYVFKDKLGNDIKSRINSRLYERIVKNFESRKFVFDELDNNWCAVCGAGVGITYLYAFPESFDRVKERIFGLMKAFVSGLGDDGYCFEGVNYWQYGFGFFSLFFDVYTHITGDYPEILKEEKVLKAVNFVTDAHLNGSKYLPYGDGGMESFVPYVAMMSGMKNLFGDKFIEPACDIEDFLDSTESTARIKNYDKSLGFRLVNGLSLFDRNRWCDSEEKSKYFVSSEVMIYKNAKYAFATKCDNNGRSHSHNDVGSFEIIHDDKRLIADLGAGQYTMDYFKDYSKRYGKEIFVCGSWSHSVPIIDGCPQKEETAYYGKVIEVGKKNFKMDISTAYATPISGITVDYHLNDNGIEIEYEYSDTVEHQLTYRFVSDYKPVEKNGKIYIEELEITAREELTFKVEEVQYKVRCGIVKTAYTLDFIASAKKADKIGFTLTVR